jgi:hypothetical protein
MNDQMKSVNMIDATDLKSLQFPGGLRVAQAADIRFF